MIHSKFRLNSIWVFLAYGIVTLVMTYPLLFQLTTAIPGDSFDGWQNYWNLWWVKQSLLDLGQSPYFTTYLDYPSGVSLYFHTLNPFNGLWTLPIQLIGGLLLAYNAVVLFSFVIGGMGAYLLARYVLRDVCPRTAWPAWVAGLIFAFSPFHFAHLLGHMQVFSLEWIPFYVLYLLKTVEATRSGVKLRSGILMALFLVLVGLCDWYYVMYLFLFTVLYLIYRLAKRSLSLSSLAAVIAAGIAGGLILAPLWVPMVLEVNRASYMRPNPEHILRLSADLLAFVTPNEMHPLWGPVTRTFSETFTTTVSERMIFAGFIPLGLAAYAVFRSRARSILFWILGLLFFFFLSLGPVLHIAGRTDLPVIGRITLPYGWFNELIPFMNISRSVSRFNVIFMLCLGILASLGMAAVLNRQAGEKGKTSLILGALITAGICFEFLAIPYPMSPPDTPHFYYELAQVDGDFAVLNLPMDWDRPQYLLYQTVHGKRLTSAYTSRDNPLSLVDRTPVLQNFRHPDEPTVIRTDPAKVAFSVFDVFDIRYVIIDLYQMPETSENGLRKKTLGLIGQIFEGQQPIYQDERLIVYEVTAQGPLAPFVRLGSDWSPKQIANESAFRTAQDGAEIVIYSPVENELTLSMALRSPPGGQVALSHNANETETYRLEQNELHTLTIPLQVAPGETRFTLNLEGSDTEGADTVELHSIEILERQ